MTHEGARIGQEKTNGIYTAGYRAICSCGWRAPELRSHHATALRDQFAHVTDQETPVPAPHTPPVPEPDDTEEVDW